MIAVMWILPSVTLYRCNLINVGGMLHALPFRESNICQILFVKWVMW